MIGRVDSFETQAVVVRVVDYGEADRILTLLTRNHGKLGVIARGARRSRRRFGPSLGLFAVGAATVRERRGAELALLTGWAPLSDPQGLASALWRMAHAGCGGGGGGGGCGGPAMPIPKCSISWSRRSEFWPLPTGRHAPRPCASSRSACSMRSASGRCSIAASPAAPPSFQAAPMSSIWGRA